MFSVISNIEKEFLIDQLMNGERSDNRLFDDYREITFEKLEQNGQCQVTLGETKVMCNIFSSLITPSPEKQSEGLILFNVDASNLRHPAEHQNNLEEINEIRNRINNLLEKSLKETKAIDTFTLCVVPGLAVWKITVNIILLNHDGNIFDCSYLACLCSWMTYKIPFIYNVGNKIELKEDSKFIHLPILHVPICITSAKIGQIIVVDPNALEERNSNGLMLICSNRFNKICFVHTYNSTQLESKEVLEMLNFGKKWVDKVFFKLKEFVNKDKLVIQNITELQNLNPKIKIDIEINESENFGNKQKYLEGEAKKRNNFFVC